MCIAHGYVIMTMPTRNYTIHIIFIADIKMKAREIYWSTEYKHEKWKQKITHTPKQWTSKYITIVFYVWELFHFFFHFHFAFILFLGLSCYFFLVSYIIVYFRWLFLFFSWKYNILWCEGELRTWWIWLGNGFVFLLKQNKCQRITHAHKNAFSV